VLTTEPRGLAADKVHFKRRRRMILLSARRVLLRRSAPSASRIARASFSSLLAAGASMRIRFERAVRSRAFLNKFDRPSGLPIPARSRSRFSYYCQRAIRAPVCVLRLDDASKDCSLSIETYDLFISSATAILRSL